MDCALRKRIADWSVQEARTDAVRHGDKSSLNILAEMKDKSISITTHREIFTRPIAQKAREEQRAGTLIPR